MSIIGIVWSLLWFITAIAASQSNTDAVLGAFVLAFFFIIPQSIVGIFQGLKLDKLDKLNK